MLFLLSRFSKDKYCSNFKTM